MNALALMAFVASVAAHPLHTTLADVTVDAPHHTVRAVVRVFAEDLSQALRHQAPGAGAHVADDGATAYVAHAFSIVDRGGRPVALGSCGVRRSGDLLWVCVEGTTTGDARELSARDAVLCELFSDQVNIMQVADGASKRSVLFTRGDGAKRIF